MKLKLIYNPHSRQRFTAKVNKYGVMYINSMCVDYFNLNSNKTISIALDEDSEGTEFYGVINNGFVENCLRLSKVNKSNSLCMSMIGCMEVLYFNYKSNKIEFTLSKIKEDNLELIKFEVITL